MPARIDLHGTATAGQVAEHLMGAEHVLRRLDLPGATQELVKLRASQLNGCGFCTDMHYKDAAAAG